ncbi:MAG TPA: SRPBCC family protein [Actinomycetota bacterium]|nr:SRPBCC family protein [Actinomycetota bacterium]
MSGDDRHARRPVVVEVLDTLPGPPEVVWELLTDWEHQGDWMLEASGFEVIGEQREGVGVEAKATVRIGGLRTRDRIRVSMWEPPRILVIDHLGWVKGAGEIQLVPIREGTRMRWRETLFAPRILGPVGRIGLRLLAPLMQRIFQRDLKVLRGLVRLRASS